MSLYIVVQKIFDFIFPPSGEALLVRSLLDVRVSDFYIHTYSSEVHTLSSYKDPRVRALIHEAKFHRNKEAFKILSKLFVRYISIANPPMEVVIPIPLSSSRMRERGYNQVEEVLLHAQAAEPFHIHTNILIRKRNTKPQTELKREERLLNVRDAFTVTHAEQITGKHIILVDDVTTTGATLRAAKAALLPHSPASVTCIALAH